MSTTGAILGQADGGTEVRVSVLMEGLWLWRPWSEWSPRSSTTGAWGGGHGMAERLQWGRILLCSSGFHCWGHQGWREGIRGEGDWPVSYTHLTLPTNREV